MKNEVERRIADIGFSGKFIKLSLGSHEEVESAINDIQGSTSGFDTLLMSQELELLPDSITSIEIDIAPPEIDDLRIPSIIGHVSIEPAALIELYGPDYWTTNFLDDITNRLKNLQQYEAVVPLPHDPQALYIALDESYGMRIAIEPTATEIAIVASIISLRAVEDITQEMILEPPVVRRITSAGAVAHVTAAVGTAVEVICEKQYATGKYRKRRNRYELFAKTAREDLGSSRNRKKLAGKALALAAAPVMPEVERESKDAKGLDSIGGARIAKTRLSELADAINDPKGAAEYGIHPSHFLLHGPPGVGKTSLVAAFAHEIGASLRHIKSTDIVDMWVGNSGKNLNKVFEKAYAFEGRIVLFFDEFDGIARKGSSGTSERIDVRKILNIQLENTSREHPNIVIACATNVDLDDLEPSLIRSGRIETIGVPLPDLDERREVWGTVFYKSLASFSSANQLAFDYKGREITAGTFVPYAQDIDLEQLVQITDGMTGADFELILERARKKSFARYRQSGEKVQVHQADLIEIIQAFSR